MLLISPRRQWCLNNVKRCLCKDGVDGSEPPTEPPTLPSPDLCCRTGCPKCIFIQYTDELMAYCKSSNKDPMDEVKKVTVDPCIRVMIEMLVREEMNKS